ncbi:MAG TPA: radical SAM protein, partial [Thermoplasmatales archaeon]|nr:radical SAM protein [Thermoplasmatales archaeon]
MKTTTTIQVLKSTIGNPVTRKLVRGMSKYCEKDGKNRIEVAVELYTGQREDACLSCKATEKIIAKILKKGASAFGLTEDELKKKFSDPYWAKGLSSTIRGIAEFGVRKPFTSGAPYQIVWDVTYACNLHCKHCYATAGKPWKDELTTEEAKRAIDIFDRAGVTIIAFSGGEPLVRPDIMELARYATDKGIYVAMATNGTLITKEKAKEMKEAGVQFVQISLDGIDAKTHDEFRGVKGAFDKTVQGIKNAVAEGFFVEISTTVTRYNYKQLPDIIQFGEDLGANWFMAYNFVPTGRGKEIFETDLSPGEREEALKMLWGELRKGRKINVLSTAPQFARVALQHEEGESQKIVPTHFYNPKLAGQLVDLAEFIGGCGAGRFYVSMRANGDLQPCVFFPLKVGNILEDDFEELWKKNEVLSNLRNKDILEGFCGKCDYR